MWSLSCAIMGNDNRCRLFINMTIPFRYAARYANAVVALVKAGIAKGTGSGRFQPESTVTTAQLAVFLGRLDGAKVDNSISVAGLVTDGWLAGAGQYDALDKDQVNAVLSAYCQSKGTGAVAAKSANRGDVAVALDTIRAAINS